MRVERDGSWSRPKNDDEGGVANPAAQDVAGMHDEGAESL